MVANNIPEELQPTTYWLMRSWQEMHRSFIKTRKPSEWLLDRHVTRLSNIVIGTKGEKTPEEVIRSRVLEYYKTAKVQEVEQNLKRIEKWLCNPLPSSVIYGSKKC